MLKQQVGVIGMAVMGRNLAVNIAQHGYSVAIYNRSKEKSEQVVSLYPSLHLVPHYSIKDFVNALEKPRRILIMVQAGKPTDAIINDLKLLLDEGDLIIDGGNAHFLDTMRRNHDLSSEKIHFIGAGISGGEEGALKGPAIMPSGTKEAYQLISPVFEKIAASVEGEPCVAYIGPGGAGHYVKMVHNGIEYGDMQLIAESYSILKHIGGYSNVELSRIFLDWNKGELDSYLIGITADIFAKKDEKSGKDLVDLILDSADNKGTGKWTCQNAFDLAEPLSLITESVFARYISALKLQRVAASKVLSGPEIIQHKNNSELVEKVRQALYFGKIISYAQGFAQLKAASQYYGWHLRYGEIAKIFRAGCIIRARFLQKIYDAYASDNDVVNLLLTPYFREKVQDYQQSLRDIVALAITSGIPVPTLSAAVSYYDSYRSMVLPANLIQAQRDYFGAHTYQRIDQEGVFHTDWGND